MEDALGRDAPGTEAVTGGEGRRIVQINRGRAVEAVEDEVHVGAGKQGRSHFEVEPVLPTLLLDPLQLGFVIANERIGNLLVGKQVKMHITGHGSR